MKLLPHWRIPDTHPAVFDTDSKTVIEQTARLYGAMNELISEYNSFADRVNALISEFTTGTTKEHETFTTAARQAFQDFIDKVDLQERKHESTINAAVNSLAANLQTTVNNVLQESRKNGEFSIEVLNVFDDFVKSIDALTARVNSLSTMAEGSTTGDAELIDARTDHNGTIWGNLGEHIRNFEGETADTLEKHGNELQTILPIYQTIEWQHGYVLEATGNIKPQNTDGGFCVSNWIPVRMGDVISLTGYCGAASNNIVAIGSSIQGINASCVTFLSYSERVKLDNHEIVIPDNSNVQYIRICMRVVNSETPVAVVKRFKWTDAVARLEKTVSNNLNLLTFEHAASPCIEYPAECRQIGLCSIMDMRRVPAQSKTANIYMWAAPHDGISLSDIGAAENTSRKGSIYLYTADRPDGEWTLYSDTPVISRVDFQRMCADNAANSAYIDEGVNGGKPLILHLSSPDVLWDDELILTRDGVTYYGGFRIYFHAAGYASVTEGTTTSIIQRTFLAFSIDGKQVDSWETTDLNNPVIPNPTTAGAIDTLTTDYARFVKQGKLWFSLMNCEPSNEPYRIGFTYSADGKYFAPVTKWLITNELLEHKPLSSIGMPSVLLKNDCLYVAFAAKDPDFSTADGIFPTSLFLAEVTSGGVFLIAKKLMTINKTGDAAAWDSYRIAAPVLFEWDDDIYLFYAGSSKQHATSNSTRWASSHIGVTKGRIKFNGVI